MTTVSPASPGSGHERKPRLRRSTPELDAAELAWWREFSDVEEAFCWVQTPAIQRLIRGHYLRRIVSGIRPGGRVLEVGCGAGWLSVLLARYGAAEVVGVDLSEPQITRAREVAAAAGLSDRVRFQLCGATLEELQTDPGADAFDALLIHGVLHHLSDVEVTDLLQSFTQRLAAPEARVFILEPVQHRAGDGRRSRMDRLIDRLIHLPRAGARVGIRKISAREAELEARISGRGDSPKETPFLPGELEALIAPFVAVRSRRSVLCFSYLAAKNLLLLRVTHPLLAVLLTQPYLRLVRAVETLALRRQPPGTWLPTFELFEGVVRNPAPGVSAGSANESHAGV
jgi:SAM-dependent methyltransferase